MAKWEDSGDEMERIVVVAAKIIRAEVREKTYNYNSYPTNEDIRSVDQDKWIPHHLQTFLKVVMKSEIKQKSIGHAIVQSARPRSVITPTLFGFGVEVDHIFGSKWLVNELSHFGFFHQL